MMKTNTGKNIIVEPIWTNCVNIYIEDLGFVGRIFKTDLDWAINKLKKNEHSSIYR